MAGNKALQKFKDSKIPKKGAGKIIIEVPIYEEPNTKSKIIGTIKKDCEINWIRKSICDEREWIRTDKDYNFGYIIGYEKDGKCNLEIESIKEKKDEKKKENDYKIKIKPKEIVPLTIEEINFGEETLREILNEDDKKEDNNNDGNSIGERKSTGPGENIGDFGNNSDLSSIEDGKVKVPDINLEEENWDDFFGDDVSKIDYVKYEHDKLFNELLCKFEEENNNNLSKNEEGKKSDINNNETSINKETEDANSISKAISSIIDIIPGNEQLFDNNNILLGALDSLPGGKKEKKEKKEEKNGQKNKKEKEKGKTYIGKDGKVYPENYARDGANLEQALRDAKLLNNIPKNLLPVEFENKDKRGKKQDGKLLAYFLDGTDDKLDDKAKRDIIEKIIEKGEKNDNVCILRIDASGHEFEGNYILPPHINDPKGRHFYYNPKPDKK